VTGLPRRLPGTRARILATTDLGAMAVPMPTSYGTSGTLAGLVELLDRERERQPALWLDVGDLVVGNPSHPLLGEGPGRMSPTCRSRRPRRATTSSTTASRRCSRPPTGCPSCCDGDRVWWNWCRMPVAAGTGAEDPTSVAMIPGVAEHLSLLLERDVHAESAGTGARKALVAAVG
jgi:hypothetical protein